MFGLDEESVDVIEPTIGGLCDKWAGPALKNCVLLNLPLDDRIAHDAHRMGVGAPNRTVETASLLHPGRAGHLAIAIERKPRGKYRIMIFLSARVDDGHASAG